MEKNASKDALEQTHTHTRSHSYTHVIDRLCDSIIMKEKKSRDLCVVVVDVV